MLRAFIVGLIVGILATVTMDVVAMVALRLGITGRGTRRTGPDLDAGSATSCRASSDTRTSCRRRPCEENYSWD